MRPEELDITLANQGLDNISWNIMGQTYVPKQLTDSSFSWRATFPADTFVPTHYHDDQEEYLYVLDGVIEVDLNGTKAQATKGDLVRLPRGEPHAFYNNSGKTVEALFWVAPSADLFNLFSKLNNLTIPEEVIDISHKHGIHFD